MAGKVGLIARTVKTKSLVNLRGLFKNKNKDNMTSAASSSPPSPQILAPITDMSSLSLHASSTFYLGNDSDAEDAVLDESLDAPRSRASSFSRVLVSPPRGSRTKRPRRSSVGTVLDPKRQKVVAAEVEDCRIRIHSPITSSSVLGKTDTLTGELAYTSASTPNAFTLDHGSDTGSSEFEFKLDVHGEIPASMEKKIMTPCVSFEGAITSTPMSHVPSVSMSTSTLGEQGSLAGANTRTGIYEDEISHAGRNDGNMADGEVSMSTFSVPALTNPHIAPASASSVSIAPNDVNGPVDNGDTAAEPVVDVMGEVRDRSDSAGSRSDNDQVLHLSLAHATTHVQSTLATPIRTLDLSELPTSSFQTSSSPSDMPTFTSILSNVTDEGNTEYFSFIDDDTE